MSNALKELYRASLEMKNKLYSSSLETQNRASNSKFDAIWASLDRLPHIFSVNSLKRIFSHQPSNCAILAASLIYGSDNPFYPQ